MGKIKNNLMKFGILAGLFLLPNLGQAALSPGEEVWFLNMTPTITPGGSSFFDIDFTLQNTDFDPVLQGGEVINMTSGAWAVTLANYSANTSLRASIEGEFLGTVNIDDLGGEGTSAWALDMAEAGFKKLEDFNGLIRIEVLNGNLGQVVDSTLIGTGRVAGVPEPLSLLLLGGGLIGLGGKKIFKKN